MEEPIVTLLNVEKIYGNNHVVKNLNMSIKEGEFLTLLGPSGCGKTTTLRMIAGFENATGGIINVEGERVDEKQPYERNVNTVFQSYALFPHMTVYDNIAFGLNIKKVKKAEIRNRVAEILDLVQLKGYESRKPSQLSGGQKQRVAIARALINKPKVLLLDEPLGALDLKLRKQMQTELKRLQKKLGITFIYVTHDQEEALTMSDRIAILNNGNLEQIGTPEEIYEHPKTKFIAEFIGESNILEGIIVENKGELPKVQVEAGEILISDKGFEEGERIYLSIRPEKMRYAKEPVQGFNLPGIVREFVYIGSTIKTVVHMSTGQEIKMIGFFREKELQEGDIVYLHWNTEEAVAMKAVETEEFLKLEKEQEEVI